MRFEHIKKILQLRNENFLILLFSKEIFDFKLLTLRAAMENDDDDELFSFQLTRFKNKLREISFATKNIKNEHFYHLIVLFRIFALSLNRI